MQCEVKELKLLQGDFGVPGDRDNKIRLKGSHYNISVVPVVIMLLCRHYEKECFKQFEERVKKTCEYFQGVCPVLDPPVGMLF